MTLARTALRLCVSACLKGDAGDRPTIAEGRVYDSQISDFSPDTSDESAKPTIILLTDVDDGAALSEQNGGPPFRRMIEVVIEFGMVQRLYVDEAEDEDGNVIPAYYSVSSPDTDARQEASLDLLEAQIMRRLAYDPAPMAAIFRKLARIRKRECHRQVTDEPGIKIAARVLTLTCDVKDDEVVVFNADSNMPALPTGFDILPEPLKTVAKALPAGSAGLEVCTAMAEALGSLMVGPLRELDVTLTNPNNAPPVQAPIALPQDT